MSNDIKAKDNFYIVKIPPSGQANSVNTVGIAATVSKLKEIKTTSPSGTQVYIFEGRQWAITTGVNKYLVPPAGYDDVNDLDKFPLFDAAQQIKIDPTGSICDDTVSHIGSEIEATKTVKIKNTAAALSGYPAEYYRALGDDNEVY